MDEEGLKRFYVSFGGLLIEYYLEVWARDESIVRVWMNKRTRLGCWCTVYEEEPNKFGEVPLASPVKLFYEKAEHIE